MRQRSGSSFWRWAAVLVLALSAVPLWLGRHAARHHPVPVTAGETWDVPGEIVVQTREGAAPSALTTLTRQYGLAFADAQPPDGREPRIMRVATSAAAAPALLARLRSDPSVEFAAPQRLFRAFWTPNDPRYAEQWNFRRIHMEDAWEITRGRGAVVAVIDTGVAFENDQKCRWARDFKQTRFTDPYDFTARDKHPTDDNGHGTHVAGTIAESTDNGEGVAGIAFEATVMPLKVLTRDGAGRMSDVAAAIRYAADHGAHVINMSLGAPFGDPVTHSACEYAYRKGVTIVCAAGNMGQEGVSYPAAYPECIAVSALGPGGELAPYSSWGDEIAISAPGGDKSKGETAGILQNTYLRTMSGGGAGAGVQSAWELASPGAGAAAGQVDGYYWFQGTSMATPHVAGVAALIAASGVRDPNEVRAILQRSAQKRGDAAKYGAGEVDAAAAVRMANAAATGYSTRLGILVMLALGAFIVAAARRGSGQRSPWAAAVAVAIGLLLPDLVEALAGFGSAWNILGHSAMVPAYLLACESDSRVEKRFYGLMGAGVALHLGLDLWHGTVPFLGPALWAVLPWMWANLLVGLGVYWSSLRKME